MAQTRKSYLSYSESYGRFFFAAFWHFLVIFRYLEVLRRVVSRATEGPEIRPLLHQFESFFKKTNRFGKLPHRHIQRTRSGPPNRHTRGATALAIRVRRRKHRPSQISDTTPNYSAALCCAFHVFLPAALSSKRSWFFCTRPILHFFTFPARCAELSRSFFLYATNSADFSKIPSGSAS